MNQQVLIESLKEQIGDRKVTAAVFYSFNFETKFFENYLLPVFLPEVNFSENEIQNNILWRQYAKRLPPISVYCDFHAKGPDAPTLGYEVRMINIPKNDQRKPCFHPKISLILLNDKSLLVLVGSNNITESGWCRNKEVVSIEELKNGEFWPHAFKKPLFDFFKSTFELTGGSEYSDAEKHIYESLKQEKYTPASDSSIRFYNSHESGLEQKLSQLWIDNEEQQFEHFEVISPYITTGDKIIQTAIEYSSSSKIYVTTPYFALNEADISESSYYSFRQLGVIWSKFKIPDKDKGFRFNHSKIYRMKGIHRMYTIIGSVNFTQAAWNGYKDNGNIEAALIYIEPADKWIPWLTVDDNKEIKFSEKDNPEKEQDVRVDPPNIYFILDWYEKKIKYDLKESGEFTGKVLLDGNSGVVLKQGKHEIPLKENWIENLGLNPSIRITYNGNIFYFYPEQIGIDNKPLSIKLRITDSELIDLWNSIPTNKKIKTEISNLIEDYILRKTDNENEIIEKKQKVKSTLNFMASHISALINLEKKVYHYPRYVGEYESSKEFFEYYLFTDNLDTLIGYRRMLEEMDSNHELNKGYYWLILEILMQDFYCSTKNSDFYENVRGQISELNIKQKFMETEITKEIRKIEKELYKNNSINKNELLWIKNQLK